VAFVAGQQRGLLLEDGKAFVYVNVVLSDSQLFVPVLDMVRIPLSRRLPHKYSTGHI